MTFVNEALWDRLVRLVIGLALGWAAWTTWPGTTAVLFLVIAGIAIATGLVGWCGVYRLFSFSTRRKIGA